MSMYTTAQLLAANEKKFKFDPLFLRLFFRESYPFTTEKVYLSQIPGLVNMALYVSPIVSGEVIRSRGGSTSEFTPGYVKPKHEVNPQMTLRRLPDEDQSGGPGLPPPSHHHAEHARRRAGHCSGRRDAGSFCCA